MHSARVAFVIALLVPSLAACGGSASNTAGADAGTDATGSDAGGSDAGGSDAGGNDATTPDGGIDAAATDAGVEASDAAVSYPASFPAPPQVVDAGGAVLVSAKLVPVFFNGDDPALVTKAEDFTKKIGGTAYWAALAEYGVGPAHALPTVSLAEAAPPTIDDSAIQTWLAGKLNGNDPAWPAADASTIYVLYYPANTTITMSGGGGTQSSCTSFGGYHSNTQLDAAHANADVAYAVVPRCASFGTLMGIDAVTAAASHELVEAATDPHPMTTPAYAGLDTADLLWELVLGGSEIGDMCAQFPDSFTKFADLPAYTVQRFWSNRAALAGHDWCVPSLPGEVYFNSAPVLPDMAAIPNIGTERVVKIPAGQSKTIDVKLFSDAPTTGPWAVSAVDFAKLQGQPAKLSFSFDRTSGTNGDVLHLTITAMSAGQYGFEPFIVASKLGSAQQLWVGFVAN